MEAEQDVQVWINTSLTYFKGLFTTVPQEADFQSLAQFEFSKDKRSSDAVYEGLKGFLKAGEILERLEQMSEGGIEVDQEFRYSDLSFIHMNFQTTLLIDSRNQLEAALRFLHLKKKFGSFIVEFGDRIGAGSVLIQNKDNSYLILVRKFTSQLNQLRAEEFASQKFNPRQQSSIFSLKQLPAKLKLVMSIYNPLLGKDIKHIGYLCSCVNTCENIADIFNDSYPFCFHMIDDIDYEVSRMIKVEMDAADLFDLASRFNQKDGSLKITWKDRRTLCWDSRSSGQNSQEQGAQSLLQSADSPPIEGYLVPERDYHKCIFEICSFYGNLSMDFKAFDYDWSKPSGERVIKTEYLSKMQQKRALDKKGIPYDKLQKLVEDIKKEIQSDFFTAELLLDSTLTEVFVVRCRRWADYRRFNSLHSVLEAQLKGSLKAASK